MTALIFALPIFSIILLTAGLTGVAVLTAAAIIIHHAKK
jgi:hypothetical protein